MSKMTEKYKITTCGLSCDLCDSNPNKLQDNSRYLLKVLEDPMFSGIITMMNPKSSFIAENLRTFSNMLKELEGFPPCPGCENRMQCSINACAKKNNVKNCAECDKFDVDKGMCTTSPSPKGSAFTPPAPIYLGFLSKRYQNMNIKNLQAIARGKKKNVELWIDDMLKKGKTNRDLIDVTVNIFEMLEK